ncbi:MAG: PASTA domain-containing protein [Longimicrobiales bacterium]
MRLGSSIRRRRGEGPRRREKVKGEAAGRGFSVRKYAGLIGAIALIGFAGGYLVSTRVLFPAPAPTGGLLEVPDLRKTDRENARTRLRQLGLEVGPIDSLQHPTSPEGQILGQSPLPGQMALAGSSVRITVSLGPEQRPVPDVRQLREEDAREVLEGTGFSVTVDTAEADLPRGKVVEVIPEPGTEVSLPGEIRLVVSTGPALVEMPLVLGLQLAEAESMLDSLGLVISEITTRFRFGRDQGRVVEQAPPPDSLLNPGSLVQLVVGRRSRRGGNSRN